MSRTQTAVTFSKTIRSRQVDMRWKGGDLKRSFLRNSTTFLGWKIVLNAVKYHNYHKFYRSLKHSTNIKSSSKIFMKQSRFRLCHKFHAVTRVSIWAIEAFFKRLLAKIWDWVKNNSKSLQSPEYSKGKYTDFEIYKGDQQGREITSKSRIS